VSYIVTNNTLRFTTNACTKRISDAPSLCSQWKFLQDSRKTFYYINLDDEVKKT